MVLNVLLHTVIFTGFFLAVFWLVALLNVKEYKRRIENYPSVTIIIPAYNEEEGVGRTIESCKNLEYPGKLDILVVNDASKDRTLEKIKKYKGIKILDNKKNEGKASALNKALKEVKTEYFAVMDADSLVDRYALRNAIKYFIIKDGDEVGSVMTKLKPENESGNYLERVQLIEYMFVGLVRYLSASLRLLHIAPGVMSVYKTRVVKKLKGFDKTNLTEDFELAVRLRKNGYLINYAHDSLGYTKVPNNFKVFLKQRLRWGRGFFRTIFKHKDIIFNKKKGLFGIYEFPMNIISPLLFFVAVFILTINIVRSVYEFLFKLIVTPDVIKWFEFNSFREMMLSFNSLISLPILASLLLVLLFIYFVFKFYDHKFFERDKFKKVIALVTYVFIYSYIYVYLFSKAFYMEVVNKEYDWGTKKR